MQRRLNAREQRHSLWRMIHGDNCFLPKAAKRHMEAVPASAAMCTIWGETPHLSYYDRPEVIDRAVAAVVEHYGAHSHA